MFRLCSDAATTIDMMLINFHTQPFLAEATSVALVESCWQSFDAKRRHGYVLALVGSPAR
jgi:hypothetical protein